MPAQHLRQAEQEDDLPRVPVALGLRREKEHRRYCVDTYEYPNKKGERPEVMNDFPHAQRLCAAQSKRVCTETEWTMACEGPSYKPYPYGYIRDPNKCRGDREYRFPNVKATVSKDKKKAHAEIERLWDAVVSGSQPDCVSDYGVYDMPGNADELASPRPRRCAANSTTSPPAAPGSTACATSAAPRSTRTTRGLLITT